MPVDPINAFRICTNVLVEINKIKTSITTNFLNVYLSSIKLFHNVTNIIVEEISEMTDIINPEACYKILDTQLKLTQK